MTWENLSLKGGCGGASASVLAELTAGCGAEESQLTCGRKLMKRELVLTFSEVMK